MTPLRRRGAALAAALLSTALVLTACGGAGTEDPAGASAETRTVQAGNGAVKVPVAPQRVATLGNTTLPFIDLGGKPVGVTAESDSDVALLSPDEQSRYKSATILAPSADQVDMEKLAGLKPDLILVQIPEPEFESIKAQLTVIAPTVFFGLDTEWKALADGVAQAGNITGALSEQKAAFEQRRAAVQAKYRGIIDRTSFVDVIRYSSSDPGTFAIADIGCSEIARDEVGMKFPKAAEGADPLAWTALPFEQIGELSKYDVITYPVDAAGRPTEPFKPVVETNTWKALPEVSSGHALGVFCPGNNSYGSVIRYLESLDRALATLPATG
ncbi:ABC transporter substrate-binding protein [Amycolatopsis sp. BJA-103]|uniref:ABC transporter substrate-binding protein n=1 Tax=Amycolatopsis sp. BJA-103 TaxID=1911175 RepID=UPI000C78A127|nr:ABC transporter substrate-binding protein [Amycolatopsis sp. BJA-103]AUI64051.1 ABC transporter substrate-binding protein [Amycolatopsis sp. BJA-103]PNE16082.1 ABC transporter substrate-binding protein [Amycolatopsis sp. BJA-103]